MNNPCSTEGIHFREISSDSYLLLRKIFENTHIIVRSNVLEILYAYVNSHNTLMISVF